ncbi:MAG: hypothetical protein IEMM0008_0953 [bacterium]|nr:MAG: hypothetical protein IEMM0008_0953 [bacterium]
MNYCKQILVLYLVISVLACQKESKGKNIMLQDNIKELSQSITSEKPSLTHYKSNKDYVIDLKLPVKVEFTHSQNRIDRVIRINLMGIHFNPEKHKVSTGLLSSFRIQTSKKDTILTLSLKRPLRYVIEWKDNTTLTLTLKNVMSRTSIRPINKDVMDFHFKTFNVDLHNDLLIHMFMKNISLSKGNPFTQCDMNRLQQGGTQALFFAVWVPDFFMEDQQKHHFYKHYFEKFKQYKGKPFQLALDLIAKLKEEVSKNDSIKIALSSDDLINNYKHHVKSALMGLEGAHSLEGRIDRLKSLYDAGVRYIGITWSNSNVFADAAGYTEHGGLTPLGERLIKEMMKLGMLIDVSHLSDKAFYDIIKITQSDYPLIASHSNPRGLLNHKRNLTDDMIKAIQKSDGVIAVVYHSGFLTKNRRATIEDVLDHIDYLVEKTSINHVALGSDFDGFIKTPLGLENMSRLPNLTLGLYHRGYTFKDIEKILGANFLRVFKRVESLRHKGFNK